MEHLIPQAWFDPLSQTVLLLLVGVSAAVLGKGADWLVEGASGIAYTFRIPKVIVGATIVSLGTTSPECAVSVTAAWSGEPGLALGNAIGSIIADTALIFGIGCLMVRLPADRFVLRRQGWVQFGSGVLLAAICYGLYFNDGTAASIGKPVGWSLLGLLALYMFVSIRWSKQHPFGEPFQPVDDKGAAIPLNPTEEPAAAVTPIHVLAATALIGLVLVILASRVLVASSTVLAVQWGVPKVVIAATLVALGTSLPELVVGIAAIWKGHEELLVGNIIGADILNVLFVIGASAAAAELPIAADGETIMLRYHLPVMLAVLVLFRVAIHFAIPRRGFSRWYGIPMLAIYVIYVVGQFMIAP